MRRSTLAVVSLACVMIALGVVWPSGAIACSTYYYNGNYYYFVSTSVHAEDFSGAGSGTGTAAETTTPSQWYATNPVGSSNEAVWIGQQYNAGSSIEGGFLTGSLANGGWSSALFPYWTVSNGQDENDFTNNPLPASTALNLFVQSAASHQPSSLTVTYPYHSATYTVAGGGYVASTPRQNWTQGEAHSCYGQNDQTWMGDGSSPESLNLLYEYNASGIFYYWGFQNPYPVSVHYSYPGDPGETTYSLDQQYHYSASGAYTFRNWGQ